MEKIKWVCHPTWDVDFTAVGVLGDNGFSLDGGMAEEFGTELGISSALFTISLTWLGTLVPGTATLY